MVRTGADGLSDVWNKSWSLPAFRRSATFLLMDLGDHLQKAELVTCSFNSMDARASGSTAPPRCGLRPSDLGSVCAARRRQYRHSAPGTIRRGSKSYRLAVPHT